MKMLIKYHFVCYIFALWLEIAILELQQILTNDTDKLLEEEEINQAMLNRSTDPVFWSPLNICHRNYGAT